MLAATLMILAPLTAVTASTAAASPQARPGLPWSAVPTPNPGSASQLAGVANLVLDGISCADAADCVTVGYYVGARPEPLVEASKAGQWHLDALPSARPGPSNAYLQAVSCPAPGSCVAVGYSIDSTGWRTLVETLAAGRWTVSAAPSPATDQNVLAGVSCPVLGSCTAVGYTYDANGIEPFVLSLSSGVWKVVSIPGLVTPGVAGSLSAVSCVDSADCMAVGNDFDGGSYRTLAVVLSAGTWSVSPPPGTGLDAGRLAGVSCPDASDCVAVGYAQRGPRFVALAERYSAGSWTLVPSVTLRGGDDELLGVSCASPTDCGTAGYATRSGIRRTLVETLAGGAFVHHPTPNPGTGDNVLAAISCVLGTLCSAAGEEHDASSPDFSSLVDTDILPVVDSVTPSIGRLSGGTLVRVRGSGFNGASAVHFGRLRARAFRVVSPHQIAVIAPPSLAKDRTVSVTTGYGTSLGTAAALYSYVPRPTVLSLRPAVGPPAGGTVVRVRGRRLRATKYVLFGDERSYDLRVLSANELLVVAPPGAPGVVDVRVVTPGGRSRSTPGARFTYRLPTTSPTTSTAAVAAPSGGGGG